jgi:hypothetical protein
MTTLRMHGYNSLVLCEKEMKQALQYYIDMRFGPNVVVVTSIEKHLDNQVVNFTIGLLGVEE